MTIAAFVAASLLAITPLFAQVDETFVTYEGGIGSNQSRVLQGRRLSLQASSTTLSEACNPGVRLIPFKTKIRARLGSSR
jgi:hypothetical protein